jgi:plasmid maintenance system antidote protein VapI
MSTPLPISDPLRAAIRESELGLNELCRKAGTQPASLSRFLNHKRTITIESADGLAAALGLELAPKKPAKRGRKQRKEDAR